MVLNNKIWSYKKKQDCWAYYGGYANLRWVRRSIKNGLCVFAFCIFGKREQNYRLEEFCVTPRHENSENSPILKQTKILKGLFFREKKTLNIQEREKSRVGAGKGCDRNSHFLILTMGMWAYHYNTSKLYCEGGAYNDRTVRAFLIPTKQFCYKAYGVS